MNDLAKRLVPLYDEQEARAVVRLLLEERYSLSLADIICGGIAQLNEQQQQLLETDMCRLESGEPVQYIIGYEYFGGRKFIIRRGALIPRPETWKLVEMVKSESSPRRILDIGTGSGCIAISAALECRQEESESPENFSEKSPENAEGKDLSERPYVEGWDISDEALAIAEENNQRHGAGVVFKKQDILAGNENKGSRGCASEISDGEDFAQWDIIVSNPPYIAERERTAMHKNVVDFEPSTALFVSDADPLLFYRHIADYAIGHLNIGGCLLFEINPLFVDELRAMLAERGLTDCEIIDDDFGKQRFARIRYGRE